MSQIEAIFLLGVGGISYLANLYKSSSFITNEQKPQLEFVSEIEIDMFKDILQLSKEYQKPILITTLLTGHTAPSIKYLESQDYPIFPSPDRMVLAFRYMVNYYRWRHRI